MNGIIIRPFRKSDIESVCTLRRMEQRNHSRNNIENMFLYEPMGCFVAEIDQRHVGHVFSIKYGKVGWIGMLLVHSEYRRRGLGALLMKRAINYLLNSGVETVRLEAVPEVADLYRKLGFIDEFDSLRFMKVNKKDGQVTNTNIGLIRKNDIIKIAEFDQRYFGANRLRVLHRIYESNPESCFISCVNSEILGYIMCHKVDKGYRIGPWICSPRNPLITKELILKCIETIEANADLYVGVPSLNNTAVGLLQHLDFKMYSKDIRMYFGKKLENKHIECIFSIGGPEKG